MIPRPNPETLAHLEENLDTLTAIIETDEMNYEEDDQLVSIRAFGGRRARRRQQYVRPMFQVLGVGYRSGTARAFANCAACYDFSRSWNCPDHHEPANLDSFLNHQSGA